MSDDTEHPIWRAFACVLVVLGVIDVLGSVGGALQDIGHILQREPAPIGVTEIVVGGVIGGGMIVWGIWLLGQVGLPRPFRSSGRRTTQTPPRPDRP